MDMEKILQYKGKPLVRRGNMIYYGNPADRYIVVLIVNGTKKLDDMDLSTEITIQLQTNGAGREKVIKKAEREGMYAAMDIAEYWLNDALENF